MILLMDGFDHFDGANSQMKGWSLPFTGVHAMGIGRFGNGQSAGWVSRSGLVQKRPFSQLSSDTVYVGFGWMYDDDLDTAMGLCALLDNADHQISVEWDAPAKKLKVYRGTTAGTLLGETPVLSVNVNGWVFFEMKVVFSSSAGSVELRHNGVTVLTLTSQNTITSLRSAATHFRLGAGDAIAGDGAKLYMDDLRVLDSTGTLNNTWLGDCRIRTLYPTADGTNKGMTPTPAGATNYDKVNETLANESNYVSSNVVGTKDTYGFSDIPADFVIKAVQSTMIARKDDAFDRNVGLRVRNGVGTEMTLGDEPLTPSWSAVINVMDKEPNADVAWTPTLLNDSEFGPIVTA